MVWGVTYLGVGQVRKDILCGGILVSVGVVGDGAAGVSGTRLGGV